MLDGGQVFYSKRSDGGLHQIGSGCCKRMSALLVKSSGLREMQNDGSCVEVASIGNLSSISNKYLGLKAILLRGKRIWTLRKYS